MPLPILSSSASLSSGDLVRLFLKTELDWARHLAEETPLEIGTAFHNSQLANGWDANGIHDAALPEGMTAPQAIEIASQHFSANGSVCRRWIMNPSAPMERTKPLIDHLLTRGCTVDVADVLHLDRAPTTKIAEIAGLQIIPARASFRHARQLAMEASARWNEPSLADAAMLHVEDPHFDSILALKDGEAIAMAGVLAMGEIGRIDEVFVTERCRRVGVGRTMISRVLESCARSLFKHVLLCVAQDNTAAQALYARFGFRKVGSITQYRPV